MYIVSKLIFCWLVWGFLFLTLLSRLPFHLNPFSGPVLSNTLQVPSFHPMADNDGPRKGPIIVAPATQKGDAEEEQKDKNKKKKGKVMLPYW